MVNFLNKSEQVNIPTGGGSFTPNGMIAPWYAAMAHTIYTTEPMVDEFKAKAKSFRRGAGYWHYFKTQEDAEEARQFLGLQYPPNTVWHFETERDSVLNLSEDAREKFDKFISFDVNVKTLGSNKYRHEFHLIALPAAVHAMAVSLGYEVPEFDLTDLISQQTVFDKNFQFKMIGNPDAKDGDDDHYTNSMLWKQRAELWSALGETEPRNFRLMGSGTKFDTTSEKLSECLGIVNYPWSAPGWVRLVTVGDPREDALLNDEKRLNIAVIYEIFEDQESAQAAVDQVTEFPPKSDAPAASTGNSVLALPVAWQSSSREDWLTYLRQFKSENPNLIPPVISKAQDTLGVTKEELTAWWDQA